jgi:hypothetical protein
VELSNWRKLPASDMYNFQFCTTGDLTITMVMVTRTGIRSPRDVVVSRPMAVVPPPPSRCTVGPSPGIIRL